MYFIKGQIHEYFAHKPVINASPLKIRSTANAFKAIYITAPKV